MVSNVLQGAVSQGAVLQGAVSQGAVSQGARLVTPVVDYEPPRLGGPPALPVARPARPAVPPQPPLVPAVSPADGSVRAAAEFADALLRRVLEVIDRRRPLAQLRPFLDAGLVTTLLSAAGRQPPGGAARLRRVRVQQAGPPAPEVTRAEVTASYTRDDRVHAVACRIEQIPTPAGPRWQMVALHIG